jgi:hypothetical protein
LNSRLVGKAEVDTERRVDISLYLVVFLKFGRVVVKSLHVFVIEVDDGLVSGDALRGDRLGENGAAASDVVAEENSRGRNTLLLGNLDNGLGAHDGTACAAKRTVSLNMDALFLAEVNYFLLGKLRVIFNLVNSGYDGRMRQKLLEVPLAVLEKC